MYAKKSASMKTVALLLAVVLLIGCVAGGTIAYLIAAPKTVTNTFVAGDIGDLTLTETDAKGNAVTSREFIVTPGVDITKDPKVSFSGHNVDAYVFVKVDANSWTITDNKTYSCINGKVTWSVSSDWQFVKQDGNSYIYSKAATANTDLTSVSVINNDTITVSHTIVQTELTEGSVPTLTFTAYAIQKDSFTDAAAAWAAIPKS